MRVRREVIGGRWTTSMLRATMARMSHLAFDGRFLLRRAKALALADAHDQAAYLLRTASEGVLHALGEVHATFEPPVSELITRCECASRILVEARDSLELELVSLRAELASSGLDGEADASNP